ncbi:MAG: DUF547 domain-containing protein [Gammaproteobacteria bacterium]|nr:DUF547 domain-containing protein [Gammaproteobacteria bacterium]
MKTGKKARIFIYLWMFLWPGLLNAAPEAKLLPFWQASDETNTAKIDHSAWQAILDGYLHAGHSSGINRFDYAKLAKNTTDREILNAYLAVLSNLDPRAYAKAEQKAYWINFYNALTIRTVLSEYPVKSITKIHKGFFGFGPWKDKIAKAAGRELTLNDIEHAILRPIWQDNRIHYAVNCASYGCPDLAPRAYTAANTENLLNAGASAYVNHPRGVRFQEDGLLTLSKIYDWYKKDFGGTDDALIKHLLKYANADLAKRLREYQGSIAYEYDWRLNQLE